MPKQRHIIMPGGLSLAEEDVKYFNEKPSTGFSPEKNKATIQRTIVKYKAYLKKKQDAYQEDIHERTDALAYYFKHLSQGKDTQVEKYFGRRELARLQGRRIMSKIFTAANGKKGLYLGDSDTIIH